MNSGKKFYGAFVLLSAFFFFSVGKAAADDQDSRNILKQGLLGAGVGAISAGASGGKAGQGALIGAGTNVIGGALLDSFMGGSQPQAQPQQVQYVQQPVEYAAPQQQYAPQGQPYYPQQQAQPVYVQRVPDYAPPQQEDPNKKIIKQGLLGAGVGAISAGASGGKAGQGALIGAGTNVIGGALLDTLTSGPSQPQPQPQPVYYQQAPAPQYQYQQPAQISANAASQPKKKIIRKYDSDGNVVSEEEVWE